MMFWTGVQLPSGPLLETYILFSSQGIFIPQKTPMGVIPSGYYYVSGVEPTNIHINNK